jgi:hypothetical protein
MVSNFSKFSSGAKNNSLAYLNKLIASEMTHTPYPSFSKRSQNLTP